MKKVNSVNTMLRKVVCGQLFLKNGKLYTLRSKDIDTGLCECYDIASDSYINFEATTFVTLRSDINFHV